MVPGCNVTESSGSTRSYGFGKCCETCINRCSHFFYSLNVEARSKSTYIYSLDRRNFFWRRVNGWKTNFSAIILNLGGPRDQCFPPSPSFLFPYYHAGGDLISFFPFALYESRVTSPSIACPPLILSGATCPMEQPARQCCCGTSH